MVLILYKNTNIFTNYMLILHKLTLSLNQGAVHHLFLRHYSENEK